MIFNWTIFGLGVLGGALAEVLKWYQLRESDNPPAYLHSILYWVTTVIMALVGGILAFVQQVDIKQPILAINIGISAPLILKGLAAVTPIKAPQAAPANRKPNRPYLLDMVAGRNPQ
jgi:hypothetical protein